MTQLSDFLTALDHLAVIRIDGEDAPEFLHAQLSNDIAGLGGGEARLAAYCNPKGRMLGSLVCWREADRTDSAFLALVSADLVEPLLKRLRMFVLRAKVRFEVSTLKAYGAYSAGTAETTLPWQVDRSAAFTRVSAPCALDGMLRFWVVAPEAQDAGALAATLGLSLRDGGSIWQAQDIEAGLGWVEDRNVEMFIPQSLNYDLNGGVSFTKGCYPGQEIVARAHFRGTVKRRGIPGFCPDTPDMTLAAGMDIFDARNPRSPAGRIINAAHTTHTPEGAGGWYIFMEVNIADIGHADFRAVSAEGPAIQLLSLPYPLELKE